MAPTNRAAIGIVHLMSWVLAASAAGAAPIEEYGADSPVVKLGLSFQRMVEDAQGALASKGRISFNDPRVTQAIEHRDDRRIIELLAPELDQDPISLATLPFFHRVSTAYSRLGDRAQADRYTRKELEALTRLMTEYAARPESVLFLRVYMGSYSRLMNPTQAEYLTARALFMDGARSPVYEPYRDLVLMDLCRLELARGNCDEAIRLCDEVNAWYETIPPGQRGRGLPDRWRAHAWHEQGRTEEAVALLKEVAKSPQAKLTFKDDVIWREVQTMRQSLEQEQPGDSAVGSSGAQPADHVSREEGAGSCCGKGAGQTTCGSKGTTAPAD